MNLKNLFQNQKNNNNIIETQNNTLQFNQIFKIKNIKKILPLPQSNTQ